MQFTHTQSTHTQLPSLATLALLAGVIVLAVPPAIWLFGTWHRAGYDGLGWAAFAVVIGVAAISFFSGRSLDTTVNFRAQWLLLCTAGLRLLSQLLDINVLGALLLAVDVFALAKLLKLEHRPFRVSPFWLACLFLFCLPIEPMVQRVVGYDLQRVSARVACGLLEPIFTDLSCEGVRLQVHGLDVLVDVPCSGAELLSLVAFIGVLLHTLRAPSWQHAGWSCLFGLSIVLLLNGLRIALLAVGLVFEQQLGFHVMDELPHRLLGLIMVFISTLILYGFNQRMLAKLPKADHKRDKTKQHLLAKPSQWMSFSFLPLALLIGAVQPQPLDVSPRLSPPEAPLVAAGFLRQDIPLSPLEQRYFNQYGGGSQRSSYGPFGLLLVSTGSPLRHLHEPTVCLTGIGMQVQLLGTDHVRNTTVYEAWEANEQENNRYTVRVSFISDGGTQAASVSEVVWHWLRDPQSRWTMVQRILPTHLDRGDRAARDWELAVRRAFNLQDNLG